MGEKLLTLLADASSSSVASEAPEISFEQWISHWPSHIYNVVVAIIVATVCQGIAKYLLRRKFGVTVMSKVSFVSYSISALIWGAAVASVAHTVFNVDLSAIIAALGVGSVIVSVGLQDTIKNAFAGLSILSSDVYEIGDNVIIGSYRGEVKDITWRETVLLDHDNNPVIIPNCMINTNIVLRRVGEMAPRYEFTVEVRPGLDLDKVAADMEATAKEALIEIGALHEEYDPVVRFLSSSAFGIEASVRIFIKHISMRTPAFNTCMRAFSRKGYLSDVNTVPVLTPLCTDESLLPSSQALQSESTRR
jgi:small-conductance mechanosensitive channel